MIPKCIVLLSILQSWNLSFAFFAFLFSGFSFPCYLYAYPHHMVTRRVTSYDRKLCWSAAVAVVNTWDNQLSEKIKFILTHSLGGFAVLHKESCLHDLCLHKSIVKEWMSFSVEINKRFKERQRRAFACIGGLNIPMYWIAGVVQVWSFFL